MPLIWRHTPPTASLLAACLLVLTHGTPARAASPTKVLVIADATAPDGLAKAYRAEVDQLLAASRKSADFTMARVDSAQQLQTLLEPTKLKADLVVTLGTTSSMGLPALTGTRVIALGIASRGRPGPPPTGWAIGWTLDLDRSERFMAGLVGEAAKPVIIASRGTLVGITFVEPPNVANGQALSNFAGRVAILGPMPDVTQSQRENLALALTRAGAYVYDAMTPATTEGAAALAATSTGPDLARMTRWAALETMRAIEGRPPSSSLRDLRGDDRSVINLVVATRQKLDVSWEQLGQSRVVTQGTTEGGLTLTQAVKRALKTSLQLKSSTLAVGSADADVQAAMGRLLPQLTASLGGTLIESDSARFANGANPQFTVNVDLSLSQLLYSEQVWTGYEVSKLSRKAAKHDRATTLLDVVQSVASAWIQAQRAAAVVAIQRELLETSRANLALAEGRIRAGKSSAAERLRWESQIASDTAGVMDAVLNANLARLRLARAMGLPPSTPPTIATVSLPELATEIGSGLIASAGASNTAIRGLEKRLLKQALATDPELARLQTLRRAQKRQEAGTTRQMFIPTVSVQAGLSARVAEAGAGVPGALPPGSPEEPALFLGFNVSLPLFDGTTRYANLAKSRTETRRLDVAIQAREQTVSGELMTAYRRATIALAKVRLQKQAAASARESAALTAGAYKRGSTGIAPVLDAQSQVNRAALALVDAQFGAEEAIIGLYRQVGAYYFLLDAQERARWKATLNATAAASVKPAEGANPSAKPKSTSPESTP